MKDINQRSPYCIKSQLMNNLQTINTTDAKIVSSFIYDEGNASKIVFSLEFEKRTIIPMEKIIDMLVEEADEYFIEMNLAKPKSKGPRVRIGVNNIEQRY